jgi:hypothetical protein
MGNVLGFIKDTWTSRSRALPLPALVLALAVAFTSEEAFACQGVMTWSTGDDLAKLKPGEVVVKAKLLEAYQNEERYPHAIMGITHGYIYYLHITEVIGGASGTEGERAGLRYASIYVRLNPSICEAYFPRDFKKDVVKALVLKKGTTGLYELVGGKW